MNRRDVLKGLSLSLGYSIATPTLFSIINSCTNKDQAWIPAFFNETQKQTINYLVDIIIPKTDIDGGTELNLTQFIDEMIAHTVEEKEQKIFNEGSIEYERQLNYIYKKSTKKLKKKHESVLNIYFNIPEEMQELVLKQLKLNVFGFSKNEKSNFLIYKFLTMVRYYCLLGFYTSQEIMEGELNYNPNIGYYESCIDL